MDITAIIREALDHDAIRTDALVTRQHADDLAAELATALDALGYTVKKRPAPRKPAALVEAFAPDTGDAALDEFMRTRHRADWQARLKKALSRNRPGMMTMPAPAPGHQRKPLGQQERADLYTQHKVTQHSA